MPISVASFTILYKREIDLPDDLASLLVHPDEGEGVVVDEPREKPTGALLTPAQSLISGNLNQK